MQGVEDFSSFLGLLDMYNPDHEGEIGGSTPQLSQQNQQAFPWPSQQPTVSTSQEEMHESEDTDSMSDSSLDSADDREKDEGETHESEDTESMSDSLTDLTDDGKKEEVMVMSSRKICDDIEKMKERISYMEAELVATCKQVDKVLELCSKTNEGIENIQKNLQKLQNNGNESTTGRKRSREKQKVDPLCRDTFRKTYKSLKKKDNFRGFNFTGSFDSAENEEVLKKVKKKMSDNNGSCKWTDEQIKNVGRRYFLSLYETDKKKSDNKYDDHKTNSRRQNRKKQKLKRRRETLDKIDWVRREKGKAAEVLTEEYMSSEVSESGEESLSGDEGCSKAKKLYIKTVPWESEDLKTLKSKLDEEYASCQTSRSRRREFQRERRPKDVSSRPKPNNGPSWAFSKDDGQ